METRSPIELYLASKPAEPIPLSEEVPTLEDYLEGLVRGAMASDHMLPSARASGPKKARRTFHNLHLVWGGKRQGDFKG